MWHTRSDCSAHTKRAALCLTPLSDVASTRQGTRSPTHPSELRLVSLGQPALKFPSFELVLRTGGHYVMTLSGTHSIVIANAANLVADLRVEGVFLERRNRAGARPRISNLAHLSFAGRAHHFLA
jgi:hypothetical protein